MLYTVELTIPANTTRLSPARQTIKVWRGVINRVRVSFPAGCKGLAHVRVLHGEHPVAPINEGAYFKGDDEQVDYQEYIDLPGETNILTVEGYNEDDTYPHTPVVQINVLPEWVIRPPLVQYDILYAVVRLIERLDKFLEERGA